MEKTCDCGEILEFVDCEWAKYTFSDCEELVSIYGCRKCKRMFTQRDGNFDMELNEGDAYEPKD